jgi:hypothetical protein
MPFHILLPSPKPSVDTAIDLPDVGTEKVEAIKNPASKRAKANPTANAKGKKNTQLISRMARNKPKPSAESKPIILSEDSDSEWNISWPVSTLYHRVYATNHLMIS